MCALLLRAVLPVHAQTPEPPDTAAPSARSGETALFLGGAPETAVDPPEGGASSIFTILKMLLVLVLAALAIYGVIFFIKRASRPSAEQDPHLRVLARAHLGGNSYAAVLAVGTRAWLVGANEGGVSPIAEIQEQEALDALFLTESMKKEEAGQGRFPDFRSLFRRVRQDIPPPGGPSAESIRRRRERIRGL